jgi:hypothetical protein
MTNVAEILSHIRDLENQLRVNQQCLEQARHDAVNYQARVNHDLHQIERLKAELAEADT